MTEITTITLGTPGPSGTGITAAQWAALQAIVASATTGIVTVTVTNTAALLVEKGDGTNVFQVNTSGDIVSVQNGFNFKGYSDAGTTEKFDLDSGTGNFATKGTATVTVDDTSALLVEKADGTNVLNVNSSSKLVSVQNGGNLNGYSDSGTTLKIAIDMATGFIQVGGATGPGIYFGTGSPEGVQTARIGSIYMRADGGVGTSLYKKTSGTGNTGWTAS